jgi:hypothetical protein
MVFTHPSFSMDGAKEHALNFSFFSLLSFQGVTIDTPWDKLGGTPSFHNWILWMSYLL